MTRPEITKYLSQLTETYINPHNDPRIYYAKEVSFDYGLTTQRRVDYMKFVPLNNSVSGIEKGDFYVFEIKSSKADFNSPNGHNFIGDINYYVMTESVYEEVKNLIPYNVGVLSPVSEPLENAMPENNSLRMIKKPHRINRTKSLPELLLMMFRSSNRELLKYKKGPTK